MHALAVDGEINKPYHRGNAVADTGGQGGPGDAHAHGDDKDIVQDHIGKSAGQGCYEPQSRAAVGDHHALEHQLEDAQGEEGKKGQGVIPTIAVEGVVGAQKADETEEGGAQTDEGKDLAGFLPLAFAHFAGDDGGESGAEHQSDGVNYVDNRVDDVYCGQSVGVDKIRHEKPVHNGVKGGKQHDDDRGQGEFNEEGQGDAVG